MMNTMKSASKYIIVTMIPFLLSCGGEGSGALKEEYIYMEGMNKEWLASDTIGDVFIMTDLNGISSSFLMNGNHTYMGKSWSTVFGINTSSTYTEESFQTWSSGFGMSLSISMRANPEPHGDEIYISLDGVGLRYDFDFETVHSLDTPWGYKSYLTTDKGYEIHDDGEIFSTVEILDSLVTSYGSYEDVMHFTFNDFKEQWTDFTITETYLVRNVGLVKYVMANGHSGERNPVSER